MNNIRQGLTEFRMPAYMEEILTRNYCSVFMRMSIIREDKSYKFSYRPGNLSRLAAAELSTYEKMLLIRNLVDMTELSKKYLMPGENYLIEPELVYSKNDDVHAGNLKLMFYPDVKRMKPEYKILQFAERIKNKNNREEREIFEQFRHAAEGGDMNRIKLFLDKYILRAENRMLGKVG